MLYGILAHGFHLHRDTLRVGYSTTERRGDEGDEGDYRFESISWHFPLKCVECVAVERSKLTQQRADNRINSVSGIGTVAMDIVNDFAVAVDDHMTRITLTENVHGFVIRQSDVKGKLMLLQKRRQLRHFIVGDSEKLNVAVRVLLD